MGGVSVREWRGKKLTFRRASFCETTNPQAKREEVRTPSKPAISVSTHTPCPCKFFYLSVTPPPFENYVKHVFPFEKFHFCPILVAIFLAVLKLDTPVNSVCASSLFIVTIPFCCVSSCLLLPEQLRGKKGKRESKAEVGGMVTKVGCLSPFAILLIC